MTQRDKHILDKGEAIEKAKIKLIQEKNERKQRVIDNFKKMKPFKDENDIPPVPILDEETYQSIIVPNLIRCGAIPKDKLVVGETYVGDCRNANEAVWDGKVFIYERTKFGCTFNEKINHFQDDNGNDVFVPLKVKEK